MFKRIFKLFQIARKLSTSGAIETINQVHEIPLSVNLFFNCMSVGSDTNRFDNQKSTGRKTLLSSTGYGDNLYKTWAVLSYKT